MKTFLPRRLGVLLSFCFVFILVGCASGPSGTYPNLKQTDMNVSWPMTRYRNGVAAGGTTLGERERVDAAYAKYKAAYQEALKAANGNTHASTPDNVKVLADEVISAISAIPF